MTETPSDPSVEAAESRLKSVEQRKDPVGQQLDEMVDGLADDFRRAWTRDADSQRLGLSARLSPGETPKVLLYSRQLRETHIGGISFVAADSKSPEGAEYWTNNSDSPIGADRAAEMLGVDIDNLTLARDAAVRLIEQDAAGHQEVGDLTRRYSALQDEWNKVYADVRAAHGAVARAAAYVIDPDRVAADWIQSTTMVRAYLEADRPDLVREWIATLDENLADFDEGGYPRDSDELYGIYHDAVAREAIPYGQPPISADEVARQLGNVGINVADFDLDLIQEISGVLPLDPVLLSNQLDQAQELPAGLDDVAAARISVRRAIASITEDTEAAQDYLRTANSALTQAVDTLRPDVHAEVTRAHESVQQASEKVSAATETAKRVEAEVTIYSTPDCMGCAATKRTLDKAGIEYEEINLAEHPDFIQQFKRQGLAQAPIVETKDGERWAGFNPQKMREHGLDYRSRQQRGTDPERGPGHGR